MTWVDFVILGVIALSGLLALVRGFVREVLGISAWVGAGAAAIWGLPTARTFVQRWIHNPAWVDPAAFVGVFLVVLIILLLIARAIANVVRESALGGVDRSLGLVFGLVRGAALVVLAYIIAGMAVPVDRWPAEVLEARALTPAYEGARWTVHLLPENYRPRLYAPPPGRQTSAEALFHPTPLGRAVGRPTARE